MMNHVRLVAVCILTCAAREASCFSTTTTGASGGNASPTTRRSSSRSPWPFSTTGSSSSRDATSVVGWRVLAAAAAAAAAAAKTQFPVVALRAAPKGFGSTPDGPSNKKKPSTSTASSVETRNDPGNSGSTPSSKASPSSTIATTTTTTTTTASLQQQYQQPPQSQNAGQRALSELRRAKAEERDLELRQLRDLVALDEQVQTTPAVIPERVAQRMGRRMLPFVGVPLFGILAAFCGFWYFATYKNLEFDPSLVAGSTIAILVFGLMGITYSVMSASWDPDREGSALGVDEFQRNMSNISDGFGRSRENAILREKMAGLSQAEIQSALSDLNEREAGDQKRSQQSLQAKLRDELK